MFVCVVLIIGKISSAVQQHIICRATQLSAAKHITKTLHKFDALDKHTVVSEDEADTKKGMNSFGFLIRNETLYTGSHTITL